MLIAEQMPDTIMEYLKYHSWVDRDHIISNGIEYVPMYIVERALKYYCPKVLDSEE